MSISGTIKLPSLHEREKNYIKASLGILSIQLIAKRLRRDKTVVAAFARTAREEILRNIRNPPVAEKTQRLTQDGHIIFDQDVVWEIMYKRYNSESSEAYPEARHANKIPTKYPIWASQRQCQKRCDELNTLP